MKFYFFVICFFTVPILLGSCNGHKNRAVLGNFRDVDPSVFESDVKNLDVPDANPIKIQITGWEKVHKLNLSTLFDTIEHVKLSNEPEAIIGNIDKIVIHDSCIYILDRYKTKSLKKFSISGTYMATIGKPGAGPEEYVEPTDFVVHGDEIVVCDQFKSDLKYYDLSGKFKRVKRTPFSFLMFSLLSPNHYVFHQVSTGNNKHLQSIADWLIFETDSTFRITRRGFFRPEERNDNLIVENSIYPYKDKVLFHPTYNDTIYSISPDNNIRAEYILNFPGGKLPDKYLLTKNRKEATKAKGEDSYAILHEYIPTDDYIYFGYLTKMRLNRVVYSKKTKKIIVGQEITNDINYMFPLWDIRTSMGNGTLVGYMQPFYLKKHFEKYSRSELVKEIGEEYARIVEGIKEEDNPIILFYKIKDF